tara:strand:- start:8 stop:280 length:273 start_codon:yes stop_codon:yes gene_type:complete
MGFDEVPKRVMSVLVVATRRVAASLGSQVKRLGLSDGQRSHGFVFTLDMESPAILSDLNDLKYAMHKIDGQLKSGIASLQSRNDKRDPQN